MPFSGSTRPEVVDDQQLEVAEVVAVLLGLDPAVNVVHRHLLFGLLVE